MSRDEGEVLHDGNTGSEVIRVGDTVRRDPGPWSSSVDALLLHLESVGFDGAPRALGYDDLGRQVLSYVPGHASADPGDLDLSGIRQVGSLIRELHDNLSTFAPPPGAIWNVAIEPDSEELICHNDLAPWNLVRGVGPTVFIDWDGAGPGTRLWDLAYAAHGFVPLSARFSLEDTELPRRLKSLADGYDLDGAERLSLAELLAPRIDSMFQHLLRGSEEGVEPWRTLWAQGHGDAWREDRSFTKSKFETWLKALE
ncbi:MAG TPA: phosphotransferase [Acidimicrobiales bacterium]|nr:phosphotransferase [Acidimicrobiales bacterium]